MPRGPRLDAPGALHHVCARGIEKRRIFFNDSDRDDFLDRLAVLVDAEALVVYAWALMPNHVHLLLRTGKQPLRRTMSALLGGYATAFNLRHERAGHLFQNRYRSTLVEEEPYFLKLIQYIHLNPLPSLVRDVGALAEYPYSGHSALMGRWPRRWQDVRSVLERFAWDPAEAMEMYARFIVSGSEEERPDLSGGGLVRSVGGWRRVKELRRGREKFTSDERILGTSRFVEETLAEVGKAPPTTLAAAELLEVVCRTVGITPQHLSGSGRSRAVSRARSGVAYIWTIVLGRSGREIAATLGLTPACVYKAVRRAAPESAYWSSLISEALRRGGKETKYETSPKS